MGFSRRARPARHARPTRLQMLVSILHGVGCSLGRLGVWLSQAAIGIGSHKSFASFTRFCFDTMRNGKAIQLISLPSGIELPCRFFRYLRLVLGCLLYRIPHLERCSSVGADGDLRGLHREVPVVRALSRDGKTRETPSCALAYFIAGAVQKKKNMTEDIFAVRGCNAKYGSTAKLRRVVQRMSGSKDPEPMINRHICKLTLEASTMSLPTGLSMLTTTPRLAPTGHEISSNLSRGA